VGVHRLFFEQRLRQDRSAAGVTEFGSSRLGTTTTLVPKSAVIAPQIAGIRAGRRHSERGAEFGLTMRVRARLGPSRRPARHAEGVGLNPSSALKKPR
jgi:hypothetical protein